MLNVPSSQQHNLLCTPIHQSTIIHYHKSHQWSYAQYKFQVLNYRTQNLFRVPHYTFILLNACICNRAILVLRTFAPQSKEKSPVVPATISTEAHFFEKLFFPYIAKSNVHKRHYCTLRCPHISTTRSVVYNLYKITLQKTHRHITIIYLLWSATTHLFNDNVFCSMRTYYCIGIVCLTAYLLLGCRCAR